MGVILGGFFIAIFWIAFGVLLIIRAAQKKCGESKDCKNRASIWMPGMFENYRVIGWLFAPELNLFPVADRSAARGTAAAIGRVTVRPGTNAQSLRTR